jgi:flavin reductase (DIM6/NTAB) family NADH-FMN oxidoreductase RutF
VVLGEVVWMHVDPAVMDERYRVHADRLQAAGRMGGFSYCSTRDGFDVPPGIAALKPPTT